jgi:hypothetical protein
LADDQIMTLTPRALMRRRFQLVRMGVTLMLSVQSAFARQTGTCVSSVQVRRLTREDIVHTFPDLSARMAILTHLQVWQSVQDQVGQIERWMTAARPRRGEQIALRSIPGVGPVLGLTIALETGDIARFADPSHYASYCRMVKSERVSNGKTKGHGNRKAGNRYLAWHGWRQRITRCASIRRSSVGMLVKAVAATRSSRSRLSGTNSRGPDSSSCVTPRVRLVNYADGGKPASGCGGKRPVSEWMLPSALAVF